MLNWLVGAIFGASLGVMPQPTIITDAEQAAQCLRDNKVLVSIAHKTKELSGMWCFEAPQENN